jgi:hypothetical protein
MTRLKKTPSVHKPPFDEESALRFAEMEPRQPAGVPRKGERSSTPRNKGAMTTEKNPQPERLPITLFIKAETIATLQHEAGRKEKEVGQIVDKLVAKHLGKHK